MRSGFSRSHSATMFSGEELGPILHAERVAHARQELEMGAVELAGAIADPHHVGRAVEPVAGQRVHPGQALLVGEDQGFVARPEVDLVQAGFGAQVDAARRHEAKGPVDFRCDLLVAQPLGGRSDELLVPQVDLGEIGEAALGEGAQQVERGRRLLVCRHETRRGRDACASSSNASSFTMCPRNESSSVSPMRSVATSAAWRTGPRCVRP